MYDILRSILRIYADYCWIFNCSSIPYMMAQIAPLYPYHFKSATLLILISFAGVKVVTGNPTKVAGGSRISICHKFCEHLQIAEFVLDANSRTT